MCVSNCESCFEFERKSALRKAFAFVRLFPSARRIEIELEKLFEKPFVSDCGLAWGST